MAESESYTEIGALLRLAREDMHLTLYEASRQLHIRERYLDALEHGRFEVMPGVAYAKGYLQAYAHFLHLDKEEIVRQFEEVEATLAKTNFYLPQVFSKEKAPSEHIVWGSLAAALVMYMVWALFIKPDRADISVVDKLPDKPAAQTSLLFAPASPNETCLKGQPVLYPPCYEEKREWFFPREDWLEASPEMPVAWPNPDDAQPEMKLPWLAPGEEPREVALPAEAMPPVEEVHEEQEIID